MARLQKVRNRVDGDKIYYKWSMILPKDLIDDLGYEHGQEFICEFIDGTLVLSPVQ